MGEKIWPLDSLGSSLDSLNRFKNVVVECFVIFHGGIDVINESLEHIVGLPRSNVGDGIWDAEPKWQESEIGTRNKAS